MHPVLGTLRVQPPANVSLDGLLPLQSHIDASAVSTLHYINPVDCAIDIICCAFAMGREVLFQPSTESVRFSKRFRGGGRLFTPRARDSAGLPRGISSTDELLARLQAQLCPTAMDTDFNTQQGAPVSQDMLGGLAHRAALEAVRAEHGDDALALPLVLAWDGCQVYKKGATATPFVVATPSVTCCSASNLLLHSRPAAFLEMPDFEPTDAPNADDILRRSKTLYLHRQLMSLLSTIRDMKHVHFIYKPAGSGRPSRILKVVPYLLCTVQDLAQATHSAAIQANACPLCMSRGVEVANADPGASALEPLLLATCQKVAGLDTQGTVSAAVELLAEVSGGETSMLKQHALRMCAARGIAVTMTATLAAGILQQHHARPVVSVNFDEPLGAVATLLAAYGVEGAQQSALDVHNSGEGVWRTGAAAVHVGGTTNVRTYTAPESTAYHKTLAECSAIPGVPGGWLNPPELLHVWEGGVVKHIVRSTFKALGAGKPIDERKGIVKAVLHRAALMPSVKSEGHVLDSFRFGEAADLIHGKDSSNLRPSVEYRSLLMYLPALIGLDHKVCTDAQMWSKLQQLLQVAIDLQSILLRSGSWTMNQIVIAMERVRLLSSLYTFCFPSQIKSKLKFHMLHHLMFCMLMYGGFRCVTSAPFEKLHSVASIAVALRSNRQTFNKLVEVAAKLYTVITRFARTVHVVPTDTYALPEQLPPAIVMLLAANIGAVVTAIPRRVVSAPTVKAMISGLLTSVADPSMIEHAAEVALLARRKLQHIPPSMPSNLSCTSTVVNACLTAQTLVGRPWMRLGGTTGDPKRPAILDTIDAALGQVAAASLALPNDAPIGTLPAGAIPFLPPQHPPEEWRTDWPNRRWNRPGFTYVRLRCEPTLTRANLVDSSTPLQLGKPVSVYELEAKAGVLLPYGTMKLTSKMAFRGLILRAAAGYLPGGGGGHSDLFLSISTGQPFPHNLHVLVVACFAMVPDELDQSPNRVAVVGRFADWGHKHKQVPQVYKPVPGGVAGFEPLKFPFPVDADVHIGRNTDRLCVVRLSSVIKEAVVVQDFAQLERNSAPRSRLVLATREVPGIEVPQRFLGNTPPVADDKNKLHV